MNEAIRETRECSYGKSKFHLSSFHPLLQHSPANSPYLALFRSNVSSIWSSQGTVNSSRTTRLYDSENKTMSGLSVVMAMVSVNLSCLPRSTFSCQFRAVDRIFKSIRCLIGSQCSVDRTGLIWS